MNDRLAKLIATRDEQCKDGNWDHSQYMRGLANGLILAASIMEDVDPDFKQIPDKWGEHNVEPLRSVPVEGFSQQLPARQVQLIPGRIPPNVKFQPV